MLYFPNIDDYLKRFTDEEEKDFVAINVRQYFKSTWTILYYKLSEAQNLRKVDELLHIFIATPVEIEK